MQLQLKKITALLFNCISIMPVAFAAFFLIQQHRIREDMEERLEHQQLQTISLPLHAIHWVKTGKEILIGTQLFDIKNMQVKDGVAVITGLYDVQEKQLHTQLEHLLNNKKDQHQNSSLIAGIGFVFGSSQHYFHLFTNTPSRAHQLCFVHITAAITSRTRAVPTPPPNA